MMTERWEAIGDVAEDAVTVDQRLEALVIAVSDVDRAKVFYTDLGWRLDADFGFENGFRVVQFTAPGSQCSVQFGTKMASAVPCSASRVDPAVSPFASASDLASALRRAATAHCEHETRFGRSEASWPDWYADSILREQAQTGWPQ